MIYKNNKRYYTLDNYLKDKYKMKVAKISLNAGFTCPNLDGTKGHGGCIFCLQGSSMFSGDKNKTLKEQFEEGKEKIKTKWDSNKYIVYFQANTNTYDKLENLKKRFDQFLDYDEVVGIDIGTRADCLSDEIINYLGELNKYKNITVELGLQTIHEKTREKLNRFEDLKEIDQSIKKLKEHKINVVVHIINGFPNETKEDMLDTIRYVNKLKVDGIKIHMLFIENGSKLAEIYKKKPFKVLSLEEYVDIVCDQLEILDPNIVVHRITGDPNKDITIAPLWANKKFIVLNEIDKELKRRNTYQGFRKTILNYVKREMENNLNEKDLVADLTLGNGYDSLYLAKLVNKGKVFAFDIQKEAINNSKKLFNENNIKNVEIFLENHKNAYKVLKDYEEKLSLINFNLGYLPGYNKNITTNHQDLLIALKDSLKLLNNKGIILITIYKHEEGLREEKTIYKFIEDNNLNYQVYRNTDNLKAPYLIKIKKN